MRLPPSPSLPLLLDVRPLRLRLGGASLQAITIANEGVGTHGQACVRCSLPTAAPCFIRSIALGYPCHGGQQSLQPLSFDRHARNRPFEPNDLAALISERGDTGSRRERLQPLSFDRHPRNLPFEPNDLAALISESGDTGSRRTRPTFGIAHPCVRDTEEKEHVENDDCCQEGRQKRSATTPHHALQSKADDSWCCAASA